MTKSKYVQSEVCDVKMDSITNDMKELKADTKTLLARMNAYSERLENIIHVAEELVVTIKDMIKTNQTEKETMKKDVDNIALKVRGISTQTKFQWWCIGIIIAGEGALITILVKLLLR